MLELLHGIRLFMLSHGFSEVDRRGLTYDFYVFIKNEYQKEISMHDLSVFSL